MTKIPATANCTQKYSLSISLSLSHGVGFAPQEGTKKETAQGKKEKKY